MQREGRRNKNIQGIQDWILLQYRKGAMGERTGIKKGQVGLAILEAAKVTSCFGILFHTKEKDWTEWN